MTPPLSPHLQIYKPQWTSVGSILHRITGVGLCLGYFVLSGWIFLASFYPPTLTAILAYDFWLAILVLKAYAVFFITCLVYHGLNGLRYLAWGAGWGMDIVWVERTAKVVLGLTLVSVVLTTMWIV